MLFQIFVHAPSLVMAEIAWWLRLGIALTCLIGLLVVAVGAVGLACNIRSIPHGQRPELLPQP